jgi:hypothetical protein
MAQEAQIRRYQSCLVLSHRAKVREAAASEAVSLFDPSCCSAGVSSWLAATFLGKRFGPFGAKRRLSRIYNYTA